MLKKNLKVGKKIFFGEKAGDNYYNFIYTCVYATTRKWRQEKKDMIKFHFADTTYYRTKSSVCNFGLVFTLHMSYIQFVWLNKKLLDSHFIILCSLTTKRALNSLYELLNIVAYCLGCVWWLCDGFKLRSVNFEKEEKFFKQNQLKIQIQAPPIKLLLTSFPLASLTIICS